MNERMYHLVAAHNRTGKEETLTRTPVTHAQACTMKNRFTVLIVRRIELREITTTTGS